jgi:hypothetical protein
MGPVRTSPAPRCCRRPHASGNDVIAYSYEPTAPIKNGENIDLEPVWPYNLITDAPGTLHGLAVRGYSQRVTGHREPPGLHLGPGSLRAAHANGMLVTAENAGASPLIANRTAIGPWEEFDLIGN